MTIKDIIKNLQKDDGTFSESDIKKLSEVTGKSHAELFELYNSEEQSKTKVPNVDPSTMRTSEMVEYVTEHGREGFERLFEGK